VRVIEHCLTGAETLMKYWLYITNSDNWKVTKEKKILGASKRHRNALSRMKIGDKCLIYVVGGWSGGEISPPKIVGAYNVASEVFRDSTKIFKEGTYGRTEIFDFRLKLEPLNVYKDPIDFKPLVPQLDFIKNKQRWSLHIRGRAVVEIPEEDYNLITSKAI
jgi:predicted RNA-binding protein